MAGDDRARFRLIAVALLAAAGLAIALLVFLLPAAGSVLTTLDDGMGLKQAALWGFGATVALFVVLALVAGDGLIGELQFMLSSFFGFFVVLTILIAWVF